MNRRQKGRWGEEIALDFLKKKGYIILVTNYFSRTGEIDIIAQNNGATVFVEVKVIGVDTFDELEVIVNTKKQGRIKENALLFMQERYDTVELPMRFDIIAVASAHNIRHLEDAF